MGNCWYIYFWATFSIEHNVVRWLRSIPIYAPHPMRYPEKKWKKIDRTIFPSRGLHTRRICCEGVERKIRRDEKWCEGKYFRSEMKMNTIIHGDMKEFSIEQIDSESRKGKAWFGWKGRQCASCVASWHLPNAGMECGSTGTAATVSIKRHLVQHLMGDDDEQQKS